MPARPNPFERLLIAFQKAHAKYGGGGFEVYFESPQEASGCHSSPALGYLGSVFYREVHKKHPRCWVVFGNYRAENWEVSGNAFARFKQLVTRLGAHLPKAVRGAFPVRQNDPGGDGLAFVAMQCPPIKKGGTSEAPKGEGLVPSPESLLLARAVPGGGGRD
jgi:hypothetical protein